MLARRQGSYQPLAESWAAQLRQSGAPAPVSPDHIGGQGGLQKARAKAELPMREDIIYYRPRNDSGFEANGFHRLPPEWVQSHARACGHVAGSPSLPLRVRALN